jgi:putative hydrolase of the HAD superfamily
MTKINTIFFDWGGVIASDPADDFLKQLLRDCGATEDQTKEIYDTYMRKFMRGELTESEYWEELRRNYGLTIHDTISEEFTAWKGLAANQEVFALVDAARAKGITTVVFTNVIEPTYNALEKAGHYARFDHVIASCKIGLAKPQPEIYRYALAQLQATAEQSLFIDDKQRNLAPAAEMGFHTILAQNPEQIIRETQEYLQ